MDKNSRLHLDSLEPCYGEFRATIPALKANVETSANVMGLGGKLSLEKRRWNAIRLSRFRTVNVYA